MLLLAVAGASTHTAAQPRVDPNARDLLGYRLTPQTIAKLQQVMLALDGYRAPSPEAMRSDVALITVLAMTIPYGGTFNDTQMAETIGVLDRGHPELANAIRRAGLTSRDYVLAWTTLLLAHPVAAAHRAGRSVTSGAPPETIAFIEQHWTDVDRLMSEMRDRIDLARQAGERRRP